MLWLEVKKHSSKNVKFDATYPVIQLILTYLTSTIETVEKGVKYIQKKRLQHDVVLVFLLLTLNIFHTFF